MVELQNEDSVVASSLQRIRDNLLRAEEIVASRRETVARLRDTLGLSDAERESMRLMDMALTESRRELLELQPF